MLADPDAGDRRTQCRADAERPEPRHIGVPARAGLNGDQIPIRPRASSDERPYGERTTEAAFAAPHRAQGQHFLAAAGADTYGATGFRSCVQPL